MTEQHEIAEMTDEDLRSALKGFPATAFAAVRLLRDEPSAAHLEAAVVSVLEFYLPKTAARPLADVAPTARLREDLGVDSLALAEAAFKLDELLGVAIETHETAPLQTLGELHAFLRKKTGL